MGEVCGRPGTKPEISQHNIIQTWPAPANKLIMKKVEMVQGCVSCIYIYNSVDDLDNAQEYSLYPPSSWTSPSPSCWTSPPRVGEVGGGGRESLFTV